MEFVKPALSIDRQIDLLIRRGMRVGDRKRAFHHLRHISYYRLRAYWLPREVSTEVPGDHAFGAEAAFEEILDLYSFDRKLRLLVMDAIERVEVSLRTQWAYTLAIRHGTHAFENPDLFRDKRKHAKCLESLDAELQRSQEAFVLHYRRRYTSPVRPPLWVVSEVMTFGQLSLWFSNLANGADRVEIVKPYCVDEQILKSFAHHLTYVRNVCAHHSRLWNRELTISTKLPRYPKGVAESFTKERPRRLYNTLAMLSFLLGLISPGSAWRQNLVSLLQEYPKIDLEAMGFPENWRERPVWNG